MNSLKITVMAVTKNVVDGLKALDDFQRPNLSKAPNTSRPETPVSENIPTTDICYTGLIVKNVNRHKNAEEKKAAYVKEITTNMIKCIQAFDEGEIADKVDIDKEVAKNLRRHINISDGDKYYKLIRPTFIKEYTDLTAAEKVYTTSAVWKNEWEKPGKESEKPKKYTEIKISLSRVNNSELYNKVSDSHLKFVALGGNRGESITQYNFALVEGPEPFENRNEPATPNGGRQTKKNRRQSRTKHRQRR
jgi:hypothetical protein